MTYKGHTPEELAAMSQDEKHEKFIGLKEDEEAYDQSGFITKGMYDHWAHTQEQNSPFCWGFRNWKAVQDRELSKED